MTQRRRTFQVASFKMAEIRCCWANDWNTVPEGPEYVELEEAIINRFYVALRPGQNVNVL